MPSIHYKIIETSSRIEKEEKGGTLLAISCPSCGEEQSLATTTTPASQQVVSTLVYYVVSKSIAFHARVQMQIITHVL